MLDFPQTWRYGYSLRVHRRNQIAYSLLPFKHLLQHLLSQHQFMLRFIRIDELTHSINLKHRPGDGYDSHRHASIFASWTLVPDNFDQIWSCRSLSQVYSWSRTVHTCLPQFLHFELVQFDQEPCVITSYFYQTWWEVILGEAVVLSPDGSQSHNLQYSHTSIPNSAVRCTCQALLHNTAGWSGL